MFCGRGLCRIEHKLRAEMFRGNSRTGLVVIYMGGQPTKLPPEEMEVPRSTITLASGGRDKCQIAVISNHVLRKYSCYRVQRMDGEGRVDGGNTGIMDEQVLMLVFRSINWDPHVLSQAACVSRRLRAVARRVLWRELCFSRAPRMAPILTCGTPNWRMSGGWHALAKLLFFCCGYESSRHFQVDRASPGHFVGSSRFSKTSGRSFLARRCRGDLLYVSDPCEHPTEEAVADDVGVYRGVFGGFMRSRTRAHLIGRQAGLDPRVRCPYCGARVWSMTAAKLVPRSASRRLGAHPGCLEYFVCVNGHLHGSCWLAHLSDNDDDDDNWNDSDDEDDGNVAN